MLHAKPPIMVTLMGNPSLDQRQRLADHLRIDGRRLVRLLRANAMSAVGREWFT